MVIMSIKTSRAPDTAMWMTVPFEDVQASFQALHGDRVKKGKIIACMFIQRENSFKMASVGSAVDKKYSLCSTAASLRPLMGLKQ